MVSAKDLAEERVRYVADVYEDDRVLNHLIGLDGIHGVRGEMKNLIFAPLAATGTASRPQASRSWPPALGVSMRTLYKLFVSKEHLVAAYLERMDRDLERRATSIAAPGRSAMRPSANSRSPKRVSATLSPGRGRPTVSRLRNRRRYARSVLGPACSLSWPAAVPAC